jgi:hypothetical protein
VKKCTWNFYGETVWNSVTSKTNVRDLRNLGALVYLPTLTSRLLLAELGFLDSLKDVGSLLV